MRNISIITVGQKWQLYYAHYDQTKMRDRDRKRTVAIISIRLKRKRKCCSNTKINNQTNNEWDSNVPIVTIRHRNRAINSYSSIITVRPRERERERERD